MTPPLSIIVPTREADQLGPYLPTLIAEAHSVDAEIVVAGPVQLATRDPAVRVVYTESQDQLELRALAIAETTGDVVAVGEDHAAPARGWAEAVLRAHRERPDAPGIIGCIVNATTSTIGHRANYATFAAMYAPPLQYVPLRVPPISAVSFKRSALVGVEEPGALESKLLPRLFREGRLAVDDRILSRHYQPFGLRTSMRNTFASARVGHGYAADGLDRAQRRRMARHVVTRTPGEQWRAVRVARPRNDLRRRDLPAFAFLQMVLIAGGVVGTLRGPGHAGDVVA